MVYRLLLFCLLPAALLAQSPPYWVRARVINIEDGLSSREATSLLEDHLGFIWAGTYQSLNRFDGYSFTVYDRVRGAMPFDSINPVAEDAEGWLWLASAQPHGFRLAFLEAATGQCRTFAQRFSKTPPIAEGDIGAIYRLADGAVLLAERDSMTLWRYALHGDFHLVSVPNGWRFVRPLPSGRFLLRRDARFAVCTSDGNNFRLMPDPGKKVFDFFEYGDHGWLLLTLAGELLYAPGNTGTERPNCYPVAWLQPGVDLIPAVKVIVHPQTHAIIVANGVNISVYAPITAAGVSPTMLYQTQLDRGVRDVLVDRQGTVWAATLNGLHLFRLERTRFTVWPSGVPPGFNCRGIVEGDDRRLYVARNDGVLVVVDAKTGRLMPGADRAPAWALAKTADGRLWLGNYDLLEYAPGRGVLRRFPTDYASDPPRIWALYRTDAGNWLLGRERGLAVVDPARGRGIRTETRLNGFGALAGSHVLQIAPAGDGTYWLATNSGLYRYDEARGVTERYWPGGTGRFALPATNIQFVHRDTAGLLWLATAGHGLLCWDPRAGVVRRQLTQADGLSTNNLYGIFENRGSALWVASNNGLLRIDKQTLTSEVFMPENGVAQYEFNRISQYRGADGRIYIGGTNGITVFHPDSIDVATPYVAALRLSGVQRYDDGLQRFVTMIVDATGRQRIELPSTARILLLELALQDYFYTPQIRYEYKMDRESGWVPVHGNEIRFSGLAYGRHIVEIRARGANGRYSVNRLRLQIDVAFPVYQQTWFQCLVLAAVAVSGWLSLRWRTRRFLERQRELEAAVQERTDELARDKQTIEAQAAELRQLDQVKSRFFADISHELRTPLTLITGPAERLLLTAATEEQRRSLTHILRNSRNLLTLIEELLELSRLDARQVTLEPQPLELRAWCRRMYAAFESLAVQRQIDFRFECPLDTEVWIEADAARLEKIVNNLLVNALKYAGKGQAVTLRLRVDEPSPAGKADAPAAGAVQTLLLSVADTGPGIHPDDLPHVFERYFQSKRHEVAHRGGTGIGLALAHELAALMGGQLTVESQWQRGTEFTLRLPGTGHRLPCSW